MPSQTRLIALFFAAAMGLAACGSNQDAQQSDPNSALNSEGAKTPGAAPDDSNTPVTPTSNENNTPPNDGNITAVPTFMMGVLPDYDNSATNGLAGFISRTGITPTASSGYVNIGPSGAIETATAISYIDEAKKNGALIVSLSMTAKQTGVLTAAQLTGIQSMIAEAQKQKIQLNLRYGYEMNFGGGDAQFKNINENNNPNDFLKQWAQVAKLANPLRNSTPSVKMFWSPNIQSGGDLPYASWEPTDPNTIDVIGVDWYYTPGNTLSTANFKSTTAAIYAIASKLKVPFMLGETGVSTTEKDSSEATTKISWLTMITDAQLRKDLPYYQGFFYFDYEKGGTNFSVSQDTFVVTQFATWYKKTFPATP